MLSFLYSYCTAWLCYITKIFWYIFMKKGWRKTCSSNLEQLYIYICFTMTDAETKQSTQKSPLLIKLWKEHGDENKWGPVGFVWYVPFYFCTKLNAKHFNLTAGSLKLLGNILYNQGRKLQGEHVANWKKVAALQVLLISLIVTWKIFL